MTKKVIWVLMITQSGEPDHVEVHATYEAANAVACDQLKETWGDFEEYADDKYPGDMPADYRQAIDAMAEVDYYPDLLIDITHYTIETDDLENA